MRSRLTLVAVTSFIGLLVLFGLYAYFGQQKNTGGTSLKIESVSTSCGCTKAAIEKELIPLLRELGVQLIVKKDFF